MSQRSKLGGCVHYLDTIRYDIGGVSGVH